MLPAYFPKLPRMGSPCSTKYNVHTVRSCLYYTMYVHWSGLFTMVRANPKKWDLGQIFSYVKNHQKKGEHSGISFDHVQELRLLCSNRLLWASSKRYFFGKMIWGRPGLWVVGQNIKISLKKSPGSHYLQCARLTHRLITICMQHCTGCPRNFVMRTWPAFETFCGKLMLVIPTVTKGHFSEICQSSIATNAYCLFRRV